MNSRSKGKRGELEWRDFLRERGVEAERGQQRAGGPGSPDVRSDLPIHFEVKFTDKLEMWPAIEQAQDDSGDLPWAVVTRRTGGPLRRREWVAIVDADWLVKTVKEIRDGLARK